MWSWGKLKFNDLIWALDATKWKFCQDQNMIFFFWQTYECMRVCVHVLLRCCVERAWRGQLLQPQQQSSRRPALNIRYLKEKKFVNLFTQ